MFSPRIFNSRKFWNDLCFIMTFFQISVRKMSGENSHCKEENTVKMIQMINFVQLSAITFLGCTSRYRWNKVFTSGNSGPFPSFVLFAFPFASNFKAAILKQKYCKMKLQSSIASSRGRRDSQSRPSLGPRGDSRLSLISVIHGVSVSVWSIELDLYLVSVSRLRQVLCAITCAICCQCTLVHVRIWPHLKS